MDPGHALSSDKGMAILACCEKYVEMSFSGRYNWIRGDGYMETLVCKNCGANALVRKNEYMVCPYCESRFAITREERRRGLFGSSHHTTLSHSGVDSSIALDDDVTRLLEKCKSDPRNARKYANLLLDIDPDNEEALKFL